MMESNSTSVAAAFEMLLEEIKAEIDFVNRVGARAFEGRDYDKAKEAIGRAKRLTDFRDKADALRQEWENLFAREEDEEDVEARAARRNLGRLRRGQRTREEAYYRPILEALQALGGSAQVDEVLDHVLESMQDKLRDVDFEPLTLIRTCRAGRTRPNGRVTQWSGKGFCGATVPVESGKSARRVSGSCVTAAANWSGMFCPFADASAVKKQFCPAGEIPGRGRQDFRQLLK